MLTDFDVEHLVTVGEVYRYVRDKHAYRLNDVADCTCIDVDDLAAFEDTNEPLADEEKDTLDRFYNLSYSDFLLYRRRLAKKKEAEIND